MQEVSYSELLPLNPLHQPFLVWTSGVEVGGIASPPSLTYLLGLTISFAATGSPSSRLEDFSKLQVRFRTLMTFGVSSPVLVEVSASSSKYTLSPHSLAFPLDVTRA